MELLFKILKHFSYTKKWSQNVLILLLKFSVSMRMINSFYNSLNYNGKRQFHSLFADMFRNRNTGIHGQWMVRFLQTEIVFNISKDNSWLEWESALSILGHDIEIKETYEYLLKNNYVKYFLDIGANYGTHSLLFLSQNIQTTTFEPNPACHNYFQELLKINNLTGQLESFALGEKDSVVKLMFPEKETWLGKIQVNGDALFDAGLNNRVINVQVLPLDNYVIEYNLSPDLIKIDTEGFEEFVIKGATATLSKYHPFVIFECDPDKRDGIFDLLLKIDFDIYLLPFIDPKAKKITKQIFIACRLNNFIAIHKDFVF